MADSANIFTGGADAKEVLRLLLGDVTANYYIDKGDLLANEEDVSAGDIRQFKVTIAVEEIKNE